METNINEKLKLTKKLLHLNPWNCLSWDRYIECELTGKKKKSKADMKLMSDFIQLSPWGYLGFYKYYLNDKNNSNRINSTSTRRKEEALEALADIFFDALISELPRK